MQNADVSLAVMKRLREMGVRISIDDFGTGYSSLNYLKRFPIDTVKIDQNFVRDLSDASNDGAIITAVISMARALNLRVVAEGVETEEQLAFLRREQLRSGAGISAQPAGVRGGIRNVVARAKNLKDFSPQRHKGHEENLFVSFVSLW